MPLGEWLNSVILQQADDDEISYGDDMSSVHERLDDITRRLEQFTRVAPVGHARQYQPRYQHDRNDEQIAQLIARLDRRIDQLVQSPPQAAQYQVPQYQVPRMMAPPLAPMMRPPAMPAPAGLDRAVAEIAARQRALNGQAAPTPVQAPRMPQAMAAPVPPAVSAYAPASALVPVPSQDLSGLEEHLRQITDQIETLRRPGVEDAINALRAELGDIGRALNEAMPRQAIDTIERQIQGLTQRIAEGRQSGVDAGTLSGVEQGLAEVRDALRGLTPAENLVGFNEAVDGLAHKIDMIVAQKDPETLGQLEHAITTLREMAGHVASNDAIGRLAAQVHELSQKVDHYGAATGAGDALNNLEHRIAALSDALNERSQNGGSVPPRLEALVESLSSKIEQIQQSRGDNVAAGHLEDQIVALVQRLDASDSRLGHLEAIERGLADLLVHIEEIRANKNSGGLREETASGVIELKQDIARTQNALDAVNGTLSHVVDRLAMIEKDFHGGAPPRPDLDSIELTQPVGRIAVRAVSDAPAPAVAPQAAASTAYADRPAAPQPERQAGQQAAQQARQQFVQPAQPQPAPQQQPAQQAPRRLPPAAHLPINPNLPPDQPIEPGTGRPQMHASARIAASEAALGGARPAASPGPAGKSGFIAAARRAAQAAVESAKPRPPHLEPVEFDEINESEGAPPRKSMLKRVKSLFIAASIVAVVIGSIQIAGNVMNFGGTDTHNSRVAQTTGPNGENNQIALADGKVGSAPSGLTPDLFNPRNSFSPALPGTTTQSTGGSVLASKMPGNLSPQSHDMPSLLNPPALNAPVSAVPARSSKTADAAGDVTGSISRSAAKPPSARPAPPAVPDADRLPIAIGSVKLRSAAVAGDAAAAYEIATRFAEGRGVPADPEEAARWYERAASKGLAPAQFRYASLLEKGQGVKKNLGQARRLYVAAAAKGHAKAMHNLAVLYAEGIDGKPDYATAVKWFGKAAEHGIADSQYNLGVLCARGLGTDKNLEHAYKWFALAASQGDREAAKKRDDVAGHLDADALADAEQAAKAFTATPQPAAATTVPVPHGGWDEASSATPMARGSAATPATQKSQVKTRAPRAVSANQPLNMADFARR
jgi:localization factor PodJL